MKIKGKAINIEIIYREKEKTKFKKNASQLNHTVLFMGNNLM